MALALLIISLIGVRGKRKKDSNLKLLSLMCYWDPYCTLLVSSRFVYYPGFSSLPSPT